MADIVSFDAERASRYIEHAFHGRAGIRQLCPSRDARDQG